MRRLFCLLTVGALLLPGASQATNWQSLNIDFQRDDIVGLQDVKRHGNGYVVLGTTRSGEERNIFLFRLNADYSLDASFANSGFLELSLFDQNEWPSFLSVHSTGQIVVGSIGALDSGFSEFRFALLDTSGTQSMAFAGDGIANLTGTVTSNYTGDFGFTLDDSNRLVLCLGVYDGSQRDIEFRRMNADGSWDSDFGLNGSRQIGASDSDELCYSAYVNPEGTIIGGGFSRSNTLAERPALYRIDANGNFTADLASGYSRFEGFEYAATKRLVPSGDKLYWLGTNGLFRTDLDGALDNTYGTNGLASWSTSLSSALGADTYIDRIGRAHVVHNSAHYSLIDATGNISGPSRIEASSGTVRAMQVDVETGHALAVGNWNDSPIIADVALLPVAAFSYLGRSIGEVTIGAQFSDDFVIENRFDAPVRFSTISSSSAVTLLGCDRELQADEICTGNLRITPMRPGLGQAVITVRADVNEYEREISLDWTARGMPSPVLSANALTFTAASGASQTKSLTIRNASPYPLPIISIRVDGTDFTQTNACGSELAAGATCTAQITYSASATSPAAGALLIETYADVSLQAVALVGSTSSGSSSGSGGGGGGSTTLAGLIVLFVLTRKRQK